MSRPIGSQLYRCPRCSQAGEWTDGMSVDAGDERDEYWCQTCGEESPLSDCELIAETADLSHVPHSTSAMLKSLEGA